MQDFLICLTVKKAYMPGSSVLSIVIPIVIFLIGGVNCLAEPSQCVRMD